MAINFTQWASDNADQFKPPICAKLMYGKGSGQLKVMFVGGPNERKDFHIEEGEELFFMMKGNMSLPIMEKGVLRCVSIKEGQFFLLPSRIPHSPQRPETDSIGLVIERDRGKDEIDCLRYYVEGSSNQNILWEDWFYCVDLESLKEIVDKFKKTEQFKTGQVDPNFVLSPFFQVDSTIAVHDPFFFEDWIKSNESALSQNGKADLFRTDQTSAVVHSGNYSQPGSPNEFFVWQYRGSASIKFSDSAIVEFNVGSMYLIQPGKAFQFEVSSPGNITIFVQQWQPRK